MKTTTEYRVRPVTRYIVTEFVKREADDHVPFAGVSSSVIGQFDNESTALIAAEALTHKAACPHKSDCATHNMPAMENGPCDCGVIPADFRA